MAHSVHCDGHLPRLCPCEARRGRGLAGGVEGTPDTEAGPSFEDGPARRRYGDSAPPVTEAGAGA
ncbi:hypothetical protein GCM10010271_66850 [Streptomyces kurssanovii]|nr:hypothetical protein GCM10010271_66850 [Streptomyces kurssanovii]